MGGGTSAVTAGITPVRGRLGPLPPPHRMLTRSLVRSRSIALVVVAGLLALGSASARAQATPATVILPGFRGVVKLDTVGTVESVPGPAGAVFSMVRAAFDSLGIAQQVHDSTAGVVGNLELQLTRRMAGKPMSYWVDCGVGHTGPTANQYRVHLALLVTVAPSSAGGASMRTAVAAGAQAYGGPLGDPIACQSTGRLEDVVHSVVRDHRMPR